MPPKRSGEKPPTAGPQEFGERIGDASGDTSPFWRSRGLLILLLAGLLLRLAIGIDLAANDPTRTVLHSDPAYYHAWATALEEGRAFPEEGRAYWLPPLYPTLLSALYGLSGGSIPTTVWLQALLGLGSTLLLVELCRRSAGPKAALAAGWLWTLYAPVPFFETRLLAINAALPLCLLALLAFLALERAQEEERPLPWSALLLAGLATGAACLARPNLLLAVPVLVAALAWKRRASWSRLAVVLVTAGAALLPAAWHNRQESGDWIVVTANGGINFWFGNNPEAHGTFHAPGPEWGSIGRQRDVALALASQAEGRALSEAEASRYWFGRGRAWLLANPTDALALWGLKLADTLSSTELGIQYFPAATREHARSLWLAPLPFGLLLALIALGWQSPLRGRRTLTAWIAAGLAASLLYFTYSRFRLPILLAAMPFAGAGALRLVDALRGRARLSPGAALVGALLFIQSFFPFEGDYPRRLWANATADLADAWWAEGELERARELYQSLADEPGNVRALTQLAKLERVRGDDEAALAILEALAASAPEPEPSLELARLLAGSQAPGVRDPARSAALCRARLEGALDGPWRTELELVLLATLLTSPALEASPGEGLRVVAGLLERNPGHPTALQIQATLEERRRLQEELRGRDG